jgi:hypothetical protein
MVGKPYVAELQVRFDEGEEDFVSYVSGVESIPSLRGSAVVIPKSVYTA